MGNCLAPPADVKQRRGAAAARLKAWRATGIVTLPPGSKEVPAAVFEELAAAVKVLDCGGAALQQLPPEVGRLVNLTRLAAPNNQLTSLPPEIGSLTALKTLQLDGNQISDLPPGAALSGLRRLETLSLSNNRLRALPASLGALGALRALGCANNRLESLPPELGGSSALESLDVSGNPGLARLPEELGRLGRLKSLLADGTGVAEVPAALLVGCTSLQTLSLHGCPITAERLASTPGFEDFEARRRGKFTKMIAGGIAPSKGLDEGVDRELMPGGPGSRPTSR
ncbi:Leucine-rich repeat-containing protein 57 [Monoraphidium neglectum]|uniref:Leucine-rich repeat-containing protein 57 n=1 Tax=Monoraphidium neglectum TaxID=145388 RepID=A0A0D2MY23_9CHLO|nr:Leucine-rich repeat-containing protein 57 [Monoraphidium neglectum]KIY99055.1 Leucine-rich repeat-containing protein 57 [Monoraphidium neglectum]|eukprot:XP_013898075.1 Leucine-rich repeat-containing protein 57 [Monoraphidium neglectum]